MPNAVYDDAFFSSLNSTSLGSARVVVPILIGILRPESVLDVGCGQGAWLRAFQEEGVRVIRGIDGDYVDRSRLLIDPNTFSAIDLAVPLRIEGHYDLVVCLEVAEHIPAKHSRRLIQTLTAAAPIVLFSAAIPGQPGTLHINAQLPSYWRALFAERDFMMFDPIRPLIREDRRVAWWFRQNLLLFASDVAVAQHTRLEQYICPLDVPDMEWIYGPLAMSVRYMMGRLPATIRRVLASRVSVAKARACSRLYGGRHWKRFKHFVDS
jgi:SAM-dependent methyltransferase